MLSIFAIVFSLSNVVCDSLVFLDYFCRIYISSRNIWDICIHDFLLKIIFRKDASTYSTTSLSSTHVDKYMNQIQIVLDFARLNITCINSVIMLSVAQEKISQAIQLHNRIIGHDREV